MWSQSCLRFVQDDDDDEVDLSDDDDQGGGNDLEDDDDDDGEAEEAEQEDVKRSKKTKKLKRSRFIDDVADVDDDEEDEDEDYDDEVAPGEKFIEEDGEDAPRIRDHMVFRERDIQEEQLMDVEDEEKVNEYYRNKDRQIRFMVRMLQKLFRAREVQWVHRHFNRSWLPEVSLSLWMRAI